MLDCLTCPVRWGLWCLAGWVRVRCRPRKRRRARRRRSAGWECRTSCRPRWSPVPSAGRGPNAWTRPTSSASADRCCPERSASQSPPACRTHQIKKRIQRKKLLTFLGRGISSSQPRGLYEAFARGSPPKTSVLGDFILKTHFIFCSCEPCSATNKNNETRLRWKATLWIGLQK